MSDAPPPPSADALPPVSANSPPAADAPPGPPSAARVWGWRACLFGPLVVGPIWVSMFPQGAFPHWLGTFAGLLLVVMAVVAAVVDTTTRKIPNWLTFPLFLWAWAINLYSALRTLPLPKDPGADLLLHQAWPNALGAVGMQECLWGSAFCFAIGFMLWAMLGGKILGAGDAKYAAAAGALMGVRAAGMSLMLALVFQGLFSLVWVVFAEGPVKTWRWFVGTFARMIAPGAAEPPEELATLKRRLPLAAFFAVGLAVHFSGFLAPPPVPAPSVKTAAVGTAASTTVATTPVATSPAASMSAAATPAGTP